jgi:hypothetical protein
MGRTGEEQGGQQQLAHGEQQVLQHVPLMGVEYLKRPVLARAGEGVRMWGLLKDM